MALDVPIQAAPMVGPAPTAPAAPAAPAAEQDYTDIINQISSVPEIASVINGESAAAFAPASAYGDQAGQLVGFLDSVVAPKLGMDIAVTTKSGAIVFFNPKKTSEAELEKADDSGTLDKIAVPVRMSAPPEAAPAAPAATPAAVGAGLTGAPLQATPAQAAVVNGQPPVKRSSPAAGIVNALTKRAVA